eukprot:m.61891 g.61891  ORF g.61891 m.61891 type:complete len:461 (+) comp13755_c0_seq1:108-1490(+)
MAQRGVWLLQGGRLLFSRLFPTVEKRAKFFAGEAYTPLPSNAAWCDAVIATHKSQTPAGKVAPCDEEHLPPVYVVAGVYSPVVIVEEGDILLVALPLVDSQDAKTSLMKNEGVSMALVLLEELSKFLPALLQGDKQALVEMHSYLSVACPFGTPLLEQRDAVFRTVNGRPPTKLLTEKQPAWKPVLFKGKQQVTLTIVETVSAVQYDKPDIPDICRVSGTVFCKAELEGIPQVSLVFTSKSATENWIKHPCVEASDANANSHKIRFLPSLDSFPLAHYKLDSKAATLPVRGFYQMKAVDGSSVKLLVQLKLHESISNNFEYCDVELPFPDQGRIADVQGQATVGTLSVHPSGKAVVWHIGPKFPGREMEVALPATITFQPSDGAPRSGDLFCTNQNQFARVSFKSIEGSMSGTTADPSSLVLFPNSKPKLQTNHFLVSEDYIIWNSLGQVRFTLSDATRP